jgi:hypothetical protein
LTKREIDVLTAEFQQLIRSQLRDGVIDFAEFKAAVDTPNEDFCRRLFEIFNADHYLFLDAEHL